MSGGGGLILGIAEGVAGLGAVPDLIPVANTGRSANLDAIATYLALGVRAPISPVRSRSAKKGRELFASAGCQSCHGGPTGRRASWNFTPPPVAARSSTPSSSSFSAGWAPSTRTSSRMASNEIRANNVANVQARPMGSTFPR